MGAACRTNWGGEGKYIQNVVGKARKKGRDNYEFKDMGMRII
jgi:hypothetical protein